MATITFHANGFNAAGVGEADLIRHNDGSGLGFFGDSFGLSVPVDQWQNSTWVTNGDGTSADGYKLSNTKYGSATTMTHNNGSTSYDLDEVPNYWAPLNIRFEHTEEVATQNCKLRIFNRNNIDVHAVGVETKVYEVRHPHPTAGNTTTQNIALAHRASNTDPESPVDAALNNHAWFTFDPAAGNPPPDMNLTSSPGISGVNTSSEELAGEVSQYGSHYNFLTKEGTTHRARRHDWYLAVSASPQSIGSKIDYGLYFTLEYL